MSRAGTDLSEAVNEIMKKFRGYALHLLVSQFKRVADSITLNITDGSAGRSIAGFKKLLGNTLRSDTEVVGWLHPGAFMKCISGIEFVDLYRSVKRC